MLSICLVSHAFWPFDHGGTETYVHGLATEISRAGHRVVVFHPFADPSQSDGLVETDVVAGVDVVRINRPTLLPHQEFGDPAVEAALRQLLWDRQVDVTHFHHLARGLSASLIETAWLAGTRVVLTAHDSWIGCPKAKEIDLSGNQCSGPESAEKCGLCLARGDQERAAATTNWVRSRNAYFARVLPLCDLITSPSRYQANLIGIAPWLSQPIMTIPTGLKLSPRPILARRHVEPGHRRLGVMSNFLSSVAGEDFKGAGLLASAARLLPEGTPPIHVYGSTDESATAIFAAEPRIVLHGSYEAEKTDDILDGLDYLVLPSTIENYPTVIREAFARGVPVISSDAGGLPELVTDGVNGLLVPAGDAEALAAAMERAQEDPGLLMRLRAGVTAPLGMVEDAAEWIERYTHLVAPDVVAHEVEAIPLLSVVVATYRRPEELRRCLEGFAQQTLERDLFEVVVVDDCPDEPSKHVVEHFHSALDVRYVAHDSNLGLGEARHTGVDKARAAVTLFFDDDDVPGRRLLAALVEAHRTHPGEADAVLGFTGVHHDVDLSPALYHSLVVGQEYFSYPAINQLEVVPWHCGWGGRTSYKTSLLRAAPPRGRWLEDSDLNARLKQHGLVVHYCRKAVQYLTDSLDDARLLLRARQLGASAAQLIQDNQDPDLVAIMGGPDPLAHWQQLAPVVADAENLVHQLARADLPALRAIKASESGTAAIEDLLHQSYSILFAEANAAGRLIECQLQRRKAAGISTTSFATQPNWSDLDSVRDLVFVFLSAFHDEKPRPGQASPAEMYLCLRADQLDGQLAVSLVTRAILDLGLDPATVPPLRILQFESDEPAGLDAVWVRAAWGDPPTPKPSLRLSDGPDALRRAAGLPPKSGALK